MLSEPPLVNWETGATSSVVTVASFMLAHDETTAMVVIATTALINFIDPPNLDTAMNLISLSINIHFKVPVGNTVAPPLSSVNRESFGGGLHIANTETILIIFTPHPQTSITPYTHGRIKVRGYSYPCVSAYLDGYKR